MTTLIVAQYKEDVSWTEKVDVDSTFIVQKDMHLPNKGREPSSYLWYIINNYEALEGVYYFVQGTPFDHCPNLLEEIKSSQIGFKWLGNKHHTCDRTASPEDRIDLMSFLKECDVSYDKDTITFTAGCQFGVSAEVLKKKPKEYYERLYEVVLDEEKRYPWAFERLVKLLIEGEQ